MRTLATSVTSASANRRRGFTLIEIMVVIAIIVILAGITLAVGVGVKARAAVRSTKATLTSLNSAWSTYLSNGNPDVTVFDITAPASGVAFADSTLYLVALKTQGTQDVSAILNLPKTAAGNQVVDAFGTPVYYVPALQANGKAAYFWSAGPDRIFGTSDDVRSTDAN